MLTLQLVPPFPATLGRVSILTVFSPLTSQPFQVAPSSVNPLQQTHWGHPACHTTQSQGQALVIYCFHSHIWHGATTLFLTFALDSVTWQLTWPPGLPLLYLVVFWPALKSWHSSKINSRPSLHSSRSALSNRTLTGDSNVLLSTQCGQCNWGPESFIWFNMSQFKCQ